MRTATLALIWLLVSSRALDAQTRPTNAPADASPQQEQILERLKLENDNASLPKREVNSINDVIEFKRASGQLSARLKLDHLAEETRIIVPNVAALLKVRPFLLNGVAGTQERGFSLTMNDLSGPPPFQSITTISYTAGKLIVSRDTQQGDVISSVQLIHDPPAPNPDPDSPAVTLYISRQDSSGQSQDLSLKHTANNFDDLCIRYADDVNRYLRPILRDFKQESSVFALNKQLAWQALGSDYVIEPAMLERVNQLVTRLDAERYEERQGALDGLREIGQPAAIILLRADRSAMSPEKQSGVDEFLAPFVQLSADEAKAMRDDPMFLLDVLGSDDVELRKLAWERLKIITNTPIEFDPRGEDPERAAAIDQLRATLNK